MHKIGLVLSGGAARANAQIGALHALNEHGIYPSHISGASAGALIGALYCSGYSPLEILELSKSQEFLSIFKIGFLNKSLTEMTRLKTFLRKHIKPTFKELKIPLYISVTNLNSGECEIISKGDIVDFLAATCAIPLLFRPVKIDDNLYCDGGLINNFPIEPLEKICDKIIGLNVCSHQKKSSIKGVIAITERCLQLAVWNTVKERMHKCDVIIEIDKTFEYGLFSISKAQELFDIGYQTTIDNMDLILNSIGQIDIKN